MIDLSKSKKRTVHNWNYALYWMTVNSEIELPEVAPLCEWDAGPQVFVRLGSMPEFLRNGEQKRHWLSILPDQCVFSIDGVASYCIEDGERITVQPENGAEPAEVRTFLLGAAFAVLSHQRGLLLLHVSSVLTPDGAIAFTGPSGAGKSTMAAQLHKANGWSIISDDAAAVRLQEGVPMIYSGVRRLRLWEDATTRLGIDTSNASRDIVRVNKYQVPYPEHFYSKPAPLVSLQYISRCGESNTKRTTVELILQSIHRPEVMLTSQRAAQLDEVIKVSRALKKHGAKFFT